MKETNIKSMNNIPALIITAIVALLAIAAVIFTTIMLDSDDNTGNSPSGDPAIIGSADETGDENAQNGTISPPEEFIPDEALEQEMHDAAARLVRDNYEIFKLFFLMHYDWNTHFEPEPFGNPSEDGYRTLKPGVIEFDTVDEIFALVSSTFTATSANVIKYSSAQTSEGNSVYKDRGGKIGVHESFVPKAYDLIWGDVDIALTFMSEVEAVITVTLNPDEVIKQMRMLKKDDGIWRLENIFF
jgi:hypothetical protein